ncbi:MAG: alpha/beta fold hydrolase [Myxococcota bacterium]|nr:alpha/beta fold hydrolase [Myxococcota bacterium]
MLHSRRATARTQQMLGKGESELFAEGQAPCVVAFHGFGGTAAELLPLLRRIAQTGYAVDAALLPGHGTRAEDLQDLTFEQWVSAGMARTHDAIAKYGSAVLVGFSLGSLVAMQIAADLSGSGGSDGDRMAGLVVLGNALRLRPHASVPLGIASLLGLRLPDVYLLKSIAADLVDKEVLSTLVTYDRHPLRAALEVYRGGQRVRREVARIRCPTLVLHGRKDLVCSWRNASWLSARIGSRDVRVRFFENSAHVIACDGERTEVASEVIGFLRKVRSRLASGRDGSPDVADAWREGR